MSGSRLKSKQVRGQVYLLLGGLLSSSIWLIPALTDLVFPVDY